MELGYFLGIDYPTWWFIIIGFLITGYAILDGFDFGAGAWHLFFDKKEERRVALNAIGPVWDGNEAWLVIGGAGIFAGFPLMYAELFSAMNTPLMLFLMFIIFRAVSIEVRGKEDNQKWRDTWDTVYSVCSIVLPVLLGVVMGNVLQGLPLDQDFVYQGGALFDFLTPYALLVGVMTLLLFMVHGGLYLLLKTHGDMHHRIEKRINYAYLGFLIVFVAVAIYSMLTPHLAENIANSTGLKIFPVLLLLSILGVAIFLKKKDYKWAFVSTILTIAFFMIIAALNLHVTFLRTTLEGGNSITVYNAAASTKSLEIMLTITAIGAPLLLIYTYFAYKVFWGKVKIDEHSY
ncbi:cytochrome D oxidase subunit I [Capnocytophaga sp. HP1101]